MALVIRTERGEVRIEPGPVRGRECLLTLRPTADRAVQFALSAIEVEAIVTGLKVAMKK